MALIVYTSIVALCVFATLTEAGVRFYMQHKSSRTYWDIGTKGAIIIYHYYHYGNVWEFVHYENEWGYIKHAASSNIYICPQEGSRGVYPDDFNPLATNDGYSARCLFALDSDRHVVIHKAGKLAYPGDVIDLLLQHDATEPRDNTHITLTRMGAQDGNQWLFVDPKNHQEVELYSKPTMSGYWVPIFSAINPRASRTETKKIMVGRSNSTEATSSFKFTWEANAGFSIGSFNFGTSYSVEKMFSKTTSQTWTTQTSFERTISVKESGPSVVVWQYVFNVQQYNRLTEFSSNIIADTESLNKTPDIDGLTTF